MVNARTIFDAGGIIGYCTDTTYDALAGLEHELKSMNVVFSMQDMVKIMGPNTAAYLGMEDQLGTLEAGKLADIVLLDGDPLEGYWNWLKTKVTIKEGKVVVDGASADGVVAVAQPNASRCSRGAARGWFLRHP